MNGMTRLCMAGALCHSWGVDLDALIDAEMPRDTSTNRKARKARARMLSIARQEELKSNPRPLKKRGKKNKLKKVHLPPCKP